jgi:hypothetical protein
MSILDRLAARLFPATQMLGPEVSQGVGRQGLLNIGTNLLQAGGPSAQQQGTLANIGRSIGGVDVNDLTQQALKLQAYRQQQDAQRRASEVVQRHPPKAGETPEDRFGRFSDILTELATIPGTEHLIGPLSNVMNALKPDRPLRSRYVFKVFPEGPGKWGQYRVNTDDPEDQIRIGDAQPPLGASAQRADKLKASALLALARNALPTLQASTPPTAIEAILSSPLGQQLGGQFGLSEERQMANQAGTQFSDAILRFTSGANTPEQEVQRYLGFITNRAGDKPALRARKTSAQAAIIQALEVAAGQADEVDPNVAVSIIIREAQKLQGGEGANPPPTGGPPRHPRNPLRNP